MKKLFTVLFAATVIAMPQAFSQDKQVFNHMSLGVNVDFLNGIGVDLAMPIGRNIQFRAGYSTLDPILGSVVIEGNKLGAINADFPVGYQSGSMDIDKLNLQGAAKYSHAELLFDIFPSKTASFHFTVGAWFAMSPLLHAEGKALNSSGGNGIPQSDWANTSFFEITTNNQGAVIADLQFGLNTVKPYVGLGFGRPVSLERRVGFNFDLGLLVTGGLHLYSYDFSGSSPKRIELNSDWINKYEDIRDNMGSYTQYLDLVNAFPVWPAMRFSLFIRLF